MDAATKVLGKRHHSPKHQWISQQTLDTIENQHVAHLKENQKYQHLSALHNIALK